MMTPNQRLKRLFIFSTLAIFGIFINLYCQDKQEKYDFDKTTINNSKNNKQMNDKIKSIYDITVIDIDSNEVKLDKYRGKVLIIINSATGCGFTPQYKELEALYDKYKDQGLEILDFPSNQFLNQAPGSNSEIKSFCELQYGVSFDQFAKIDVNGKNASPVFKYLKKQKGGFLSSRIKWNFTKFLISRDGKVIKRYAPQTKPMQIEEDLKKLL